MGIRKGLVWENSQPFWFCGRGSLGAEDVGGGWIRHTLFYNGGFQDECIGTECRTGFDAWLWRSWKLLCDWNSIKFC